MWTCLVQFYHGVNPNTLDDDEFVEHIVRLKWSLQKTNQWES